MLYVKKKLTPLKKGYSGDPMSGGTKDKRNLKITFLNIEKLELVKMYENTNSNDSKSSFSPIKKTSAMTSSLITKGSTYNN